MTILPRFLPMLAVPGGLCLAPVCPALAAVARANFLAAACTVPLAVATGLAAWQWPFEGTRLNGNLRLHLPCALTPAALVALTGHLGGFLSGVNGALNP